MRKRYPRLNPRKIFRPRVEPLEDRRLLAAVMTVNSPADGNTRDAALTLREAILINNRTLLVSNLSALEQLQVSGSPTGTDADTINFGIVGLGVQTISPTSALPTISEPLTINGYSQIGASVNTNSPAQALNTALQIELAGNLAGGATGLRLGTGSDGSTIRGLAINRFANGIWIDSSGNTIVGSFVGTNPAGTAALPNTANGILIIGGDNNVIGGTSPADSNLISGNATNGVTLVTNAQGTVVRGNRIGTDATGTVDLGNTIYGILAAEAANTTIGGIVAGAGNLISGNNSHGILFQGSSHDSLIQGNKIGTTLAGTAALRNTGDGVRVDSPMRLAIGGAAGGNIIAFNNGTGVRDVASSTLISANSIFANGALGIDRGIVPGQAYPPDFLDLPYPILIAAAESGGTTKVQGVFASSSFSRSLRVEFFANGQIDAAFFGEGQTYLGFIDVEMVAGNAGATFTAILPALPAGQTFITATTTDVTVSGSGPVNITSEFSPPLSATSPPPVITVTNTADAGDGSLYRAIERANSRPGPDRIEFNIPADDPGHVYYKNDNIPGQVTRSNITPTTAATDAGIADIDPDWPHSWFTIRPTSPLPDLADVSLTIDGYTQPGSAPNTNGTDQGLNSVLKIEINGEASENVGALSNGLLRFAGGLSGFGALRGLVLNRAYFSFGPVPLVGLYGDLDNFRLEGNYLGTDVSGTHALAATIPGGFSGAGFVRVDANDSVIGGLEPASRNLITSISVFNAAGTGLQTRIEGNLVGTDRAGSRALAGGGSIGGGRDTVIGGPNPAARNVIAGGVGLGTRNLLQNNLIGVGVNGTQITSESEFATVGVNVAQHDNRVLQNTVAYQGGDGISIRGDQNLISENRIFSNLGSGIAVDIGGEQNLLTQNAIYANVGIGIDLINPGDNLPGGVSSNDVPPASDPPDQDTGPNGLQNYPVLTSVTAAGGGTHIEGTLASTPSSNFRLEFYASAERDESSGGLVAEGQTYLGSLDVNTNANGNANFSVDFPVNLLTLPGAGGQPFVTATATATDITNPGAGPRNSTSEYSLTEPLGGCSFTVTTTADAGVGTLREAIHCANLATGSREIIEFALPPSDPRHFYYRDDGVPGGVTADRATATTATSDEAVADIDPDWPHSWYSIRPTRELPAITESVVIDGYTQPGSSANSLPAPQQLNTVLRVELDGSLATGSGLRFTGGALGAQIAGLAINRWAENGMEFDFGAGHFITGNAIGVDVSGLLDEGNTGHGLQLENVHGAKIGGVAPSERNLISGNGVYGLNIHFGGGHLIYGNLFGSNLRRTFSIENAGGHIVLDRASLNTTGGPFEELGNVLAVDLGGVEGDFGVQAALDLPPPVVLTFPPNSPPTPPDDEDAYEINRCLEARRSLIDASNAHSASPFPIWQPFVREAEAELAECLSDLASLGREGVKNAINHGQTIDLPGVHEPTQSGPLPLSMNKPLQTAAVFKAIDRGSTDASQWPNFPVLHAATAANNAVIVGSISSGMANSSARIEFYANTHGPNFRAGEEFLGSLEVTTNPAGSVSFAFASPKSVPAGSYITATTTWMLDADDDLLTPSELFETSEFSAGIAVRQNPWHNPAKALDVKPDGKTVAGDALEIINYINAFGSGLVPPNAQLGIPAYYDTTNDAFVAPNDVLGVINYINAFGADADGLSEAEGEATAMTQGSQVPLDHSDWLALLALDVAHAMTPRRRGA